VYDPATNTSYTSAGVFSGVILDVEPPAADQNLLTLYACSQQTARQHYLGLAVAINAFWNNPTGSGAPAYQQILNNGVQQRRDHGIPQLRGHANWPSSNPTFPTGVSVQFVSAGVPSAVSIGAAMATITFPNVSNSNATVTVTPVNPAIKTPAPAGFQLTNLAFDISTTALFTGPVKVCFGVPSLDPAASARLRVLHYLGGAPADQTHPQRAERPQSGHEHDLRECDLAQHLRSGKADGRCSASVSGELGRMAITTVSTSRER
jgi:hypothetical protein